jgi:metal transporter CNNM
MATPTTTTTTTNAGGDALHTMATPTTTTMTNAGGDQWDPQAISEVVDMWELTEKEQTDLLTLKDQLKDISHAKNRPAEVVRFLRARPGKVDAAESMFRAMVEWRIANNVDTILQDYQPPQRLLDFYPGAILEGLDKAGDPVYVGRVGVTDGAGILQQYGREEMVRHAIWMRELVSTGPWIQKYEQEQGRPVRRITLIEDLEGMSISHSMNRELLSVHGEIMRLDQDNYPETAKKLIIVRAPTLFRMVWSIFKHFFDAGVVQKMVFCGSSDYQKVMAEYVDLSVLPIEIVPDGQGKATEGMPSKFEGGLLPKE